jgi:hypothetical protein
MEKYELLVINDSGYGHNFWLTSTSTSELAFLSSQLNQVFPHPGSELGGIVKLPSGEIHGYAFNCTGRADMEYGAALWWTIKQLCLRGWEPMGATAAYNSNIFYNFKRKAIA